MTKLTPSLFTHDLPRILFIDMNSFFASVEQQTNRDLRNRPIIVAPLVADTTCAISASYEARAYGIKTGTMIRDAKRLCPSVIVVAASPYKYVDYHERLIEVLEHYFAEIKVLSVDEMSCVLSERHRNAASAAKLGERIKTHIYASLGPYLKCSIGIAPNVFLSKVASDIRKPNGLTVFEGDYTPYLFELELTDLPGIARRTAIRLKEKNIYTTEDLWNAPPKLLRAAWGGVVGERWYYMLRGSLEADYGMYGDGEKKSVGHSHVLPPEFRHREGARDILLRLTSKALKRLRSYNQEAKVYAASITYRHAREYHKKYRWQIERKREIATNDDLYWIPLAEQWSNEAPLIPDLNPVKVSICFYGLSHASQQQTSLFGDRTKYINLLKTVDTINEAHGYSVDVARVFHLKRQAPFRISFGKVDREEE